MSPGWFCDGLVLLGSSVCSGLPGLFGFAVSFFGLAGFSFTGFGGGFPFSGFFAGNFEASLIFVPSVSYKHNTCLSQQMLEISS